MLDSIAKTEETYCEQLSVGHRELICVLDLAGDELDMDVVLSKSDEELADLTGVSKRSSRRLKKILSLYEEQNRLHLN